jgi:hypothetical protein
MGRTGFEPRAFPGVGATAADYGVTMNKGFLGSLAIVLSSTGLALAQAAGPEALPAAETAQPPPASTAMNAASAPAAEASPVDRQPWNPSLKQGVQRPYPEPPHGWLRGFCPDLEEFWLGADYLLWAMKGGRLPPLVTTSPPNSLGILGQPGTSILIGDTDTNRGAFSGGHFVAGVWLDDDQNFGFEGTYFFLAERSVNFTANSTGSPNSAALARPFFNILTNQEDSEVLALPGQQPASIRVSATTSLQGAEATGVVGLCSGDCFRLEMLIGFRYLELDDKLGIAEQVAFLPNAPVNAGSIINQVDQFDVGNRYYGGQLGLRAEWCYHGFLFGALGKLAFGANEEIIDIAGASRFAPPMGTPLISAGGLLAQPSNIGRFTHSQFAVVPELGVHVGYQFGRHVRLFAGYTFLYWSDVVRSGDQIDRGLNATQTPVVQPAGPLLGPARPAIFFHQTDFWAQGGTFGLELRY